MRTTTGCSLVVVQMRTKAVKDLLKVKVLSIFYKSIVLLLKYRMRILLPPRLKCDNLLSILYVYMYAQSYTCIIYMTEHSLFAVILYFNSHDIILMYLLLLVTK